MKEWKEAMSCTVLLTILKEKGYNILIMRNSLEKIKGGALSLTVQDRAKLAKILIYSLDAEIRNDLHGISWDVELEKRVKKILDDEVKGIPAEEVFAKIRKKYH